MKKLFVCIVLLALLCGCVDTIEDTGYTFEDSLGRNVTVSSCDRTAVLLGSYTDLWMLAGGDVCATADDAWDDYDINLPKYAVNLGGTENLSLEKLISAEPDFVIATSKRKQHIDWKPTLEAMGISVAYFDVNDFDGYLEMLDICTDITGRKDLYQKNGLDIRDRIGDTLAGAEEKYTGDSYLLLRASATYIRAKKSEGTVLGEMLTDFGCVNIADSEEGILENLNIESIIACNPKHIFIVQAGDNPEGMKKAVENMFSENPVWQELDAFKNGRIHFMDKKLFNFKPNSRWGEAYVELEKALSR